MFIIFGLALMGLGWLLGVGAIDRINRLSDRRSPARPDSDRFRFLVWTNPRHFDPEVRGAVADLRARLFAAAMGFLAGALLLTRGLHGR